MPSNIPSNISTLFLTSVHKSVLMLLFGYGLCLSIYPQQPPCYLWWKEHNNFIVFPKRLMVAITMTDQVDNMGRMYQSISRKATFITILYITYVVKNAVFHNDYISSEGYVELLILWYIMNGDLFISIPSISGKNAQYGIACIIKLVATCPWPKNH